MQVLAMVAATSKKTVKLATSISKTVQGQLARTGNSP
jgi:hypothetical protein